MLQQAPGRDLVSSYRGAREQREIDLGGRSCAGVRLLELRIRKINGTKKLHTPGVREIGGLVKPAKLAARARTGCRDAAC
jgi:hypothetical protein